MEDKELLLLSAKGTTSSTGMRRNDINPGKGKPEVQPAFVTRGVPFFITIAELGEQLANEKMTRKVTLLIALHICIC